MQEDEFEKKIQNKLVAFELAPNDEVWQKVSVRISKEKKKRRIFIFWFFLVFLLIAGTSALVVINVDKNKTGSNKTNYNAVEKTNNTGRKAITDTSAVIKNVVEAKEKPVAVFVKKRSLHYAKSSAVKEEDQPKKMLGEIVKATKEITSKKAKTDIYSSTNKPAEKLFFPHKFYNPGLVAKNDSVNPNRVTSVKSSVNKDSADKMGGKKITQQKKPEKKWQFGLTVYGGFANNFSGMQTPGRSYVNSFTPGAPYNNGIDSSGKFRRGFSFGVGFFVKKQLTQKVSLSTGIDFHSYMVQSKVGNNVAPQGILLDPISSSLVSAGTYYAAGNSITYLNKYRLIEVPINVGYRLNKNSKKPVLISAGISPGFLVSTNALFNNNVARVYYVDQQKFHRFQFSSQAGLLLPLSASRGYLLSAGPTVQYGLGNAAKASSGTTQHLFFTGLKATITFK